MIGKIIKKIRTDNNYSQEELANLINIGRSTVSDYEREKTAPSFETIEDICDKCNYEIFFKNKKSNEVLNSKNIIRKDI